MRIVRKGSGVVVVSYRGVCKLSNQCCASQLYCAETPRLERPTSRQQAPGAHSRVTRHQFFRDSSAGSSSWRVRADRNTR